MIAVKARQLFRLILCGSLIVLPFIFWPLSSIPFEVPRVMFIHRVIEILCIIGLISLFLEKRRFQIHFSPFILLVAFVVVATLASLAGVDISKSIVGNFYRHDGLLTLWRFTGFAVLVGLVWDDNLTFPVTVSVILGSITVSVLTIVSALLSPQGYSFFPPWQGAFGVTFGQPIFLAGYLTVTFPFFIYIYKIASPRYKSVVLLSLLVQFMALGLTRSWGSLITVIVMVMLYIFYSIRISKRIKRIGIVGIAIVLLGLTTVIWIKKNELPQSVNAESRQRIFTKLTLATLKRPLLGWGWANVDHAFESVDWPYKFTVDVYVDKAHSTLLETLTTTGVVGLTIYMTFVTTVLYTLYKEYKKHNNYKNHTREHSNVVWIVTLIIAIVAYLIHSQTNIVGIAEEYIFWLMIGISLHSSL